MKDRNYFPMERNRYYYGKLLSVEDFQREQAYMNHKRRLLNRLLYGDGILCGMQVLEVDEESISIEMGVALDAFGREIVVEQPIVKRLSVIDGFQENYNESKSEGALYLCIEYSEQATDPIYSIGTTTKNEEGKPVEFNRWKEGYHLFLTSEEPEKNTGFLEEIYEESHTLFANNGIRIRQIVPRYVQCGEDLVIQLFIDKGGSKEEIAFQYELEFIGASNHGQEHMLISFQETDWTPSDTYYLKYVVQAALQEMEGSVRIRPNSFLLEIGSHKQTFSVEGNFTFHVIQERQETAVWKSVCEGAAEDILSPAQPPRLYLARIHFIQAGDTYVIEGVDRRPFGQYVWNNRLLGAMEQMSLVKPENRQPVKVDSTLPAKTIETGENILQHRVAAGTVEIPLGIGGAAGQCFYSGEIVHGLGLGSVFITVGAVIPKRQGREVVFGTRDIFQENAGQVNVETAVKLYMDKGSFQIGVRCLKEIHGDVLTINWLAIRERETTSEEKKTMTIQPEMPRIHVRETQYFEALVGDERLSRVEWSVKEPEGGSINENGLYQAPSQPGIYEILAQSLEDRNLRAFVYVIVAEEA